MLKYIKELLLPDINKYAYRIIVIGSLDGSRDNYFKLDCSGIMYHIDTILADQVLSKAAFKYRCPSIIGIVHLLDKNKYIVTDKAVNITKKYFLEKIEYRQDMYRLLFDTVQLGVQLGEHKNISNNLGIHHSKLWYKW